MVTSFASHEVHARADVPGARSLRDELESECIAAGGDTVCASIVSPVHRAVGGTSYGTGTQSVPCIAGVTVGGAGGTVQPAPIRVKHDSSSLSRAGAGASALLNTECGVGFRHLRAYL